MTDRYRKRIRHGGYALIAGSLTLLALASAAPAAAAAPPPGPQVNTAGADLNVRTGPSTSYARIATLRNNTVLTVSCQVTGQHINGKRSTAQWDRLVTGGYVSDAYVTRGPNPIPTCDSPTSSRSTTPSTPAVKVSPARAEFLRQAGLAARRTYAEYKVPASVTVAQAILESGWGTSGLTSNDRNYFGIKCFGGPGPIAVGCHDYATTECDKPTGCYKTRATFRVYRSATDSFRDHGRFLVENRRYRFAFAYSHDPDQFAAEIHKAGYATDPLYTEKLLRLMRSHNLYQYDR